jgi:hypothetical protein
MTSKNIKVKQIFEYLIPSNAFGIKKIEVTALLYGKVNILLN